MDEPFVIAVAKLSLAIADLQDTLAKMWDNGIGRLVGPSKFPRWARERRALAWKVLGEWPESFGGWLPDNDSPPFP